MAEKLDSNQCYVALLHNEMSIKSDLVFDSRSGELVGFMNKEKWTFCEGREKVATHALVFYVVGINSNLKISLGFFGTRTATADVLYPLFWQAVGCLEECGPKVVVSTSDKAAANQKLYQLHGQQEEVCYKTVNLFAPDREIFFISDPPHLIKTVRNNIAHSGSGTNTRMLWNNDQRILWQHISEMYKTDLKNGLRRTPLTAEHIYLTPHSVMNVKLAAQVLSYRVGRVLHQYGGAHMQETAKFVLLMDRFFDCLNTRNRFEANHSRNLIYCPTHRSMTLGFIFLKENSYST